MFRAILNERFYSYFLLGIVTFSFIVQEMLSVLPDLKSANIQITTHWKLRRSTAETASNAQSAKTVKVLKRAALRGLLLRCAFLPLFKTFRQ